MQRRTLFRAAAVIAALPGIARRTLGAATQDPLQVYRRLGLRPIINAAGTYTHLGGSLMPPEVIAAMNDAAQGYVPIRDLTKATGERIAQLTGNEAALVTTGAAGAIFVGTCACIAGDDPDKAKRLTFTDGMKNEVVTEASRDRLDTAMRSSRRPHDRCRIPGSDGARGQRPHGDDLLFSRRQAFRR